MAASATEAAESSGARTKVHEIIFEAETPAGKGFDVALLLVIAASVVTVSLESVADIRVRHGSALNAAEWTFTILFTVEYALRLWCVLKPLRYAVSFFGIVDLLAILPSYVSLLVPGTEPLLVIRGLRLLRVFRVFKLAHFLGEADVLLTALRGARAKIVVFIGAVLTVVTIMGALLYIVEGPEHGFTSIPTAVYWAIVTLTTVGYGDLSPQTTLGQLLASIVMILGYGIIAVPTGIFSAELIRAHRPVSARACPSCGGEGHDTDAVHCKLCGAAL